MHIVSKFKDFYDYLQYSFGQDDNIYWDRDVILKDKDENFIIKSTDLIELNIKYKYNNMFRHHLFMDDFEFRCLSVLGDVYVIIRYKENNKVITSYLTFDLFCKYKKHINSCIDLLNNKNKSEYDFYLEKIEELSKDHDELLKISYLLKQPIFMYEVHYSVKTKSYLNIYNKIPNLSEIKNIISLIDPIELYKNLYNFHVELYNNDINDKSLDVDNISKIHKAGFDIKNSFRKNK